ncbi:Uncharacterized protein dnl_21640 [Desulfonema limicola]|uniref:Uncharacterized protein n=1 Tax=Desulfonema limicola TaxID=45656 RepID=A0A975B6T6_9BACT|nr:hypothetical protein [Desulfonema limicola]QTA79882.1 Uncharacterized protein dnl_21640 [Desulfonema limicola]
MKVSGTISGTDFEKALKIEKIDIRHFPINNLPSNPKGFKNP